MVYILLEVEFKGRRSWWEEKYGVSKLVRLSREIKVREYYRFL